MDLISREMALTAITDALSDWNMEDSGLPDAAKACRAIRNLPSAATLPSAQTERKKGKWIDYAEDGYVECPFCHSATNCDGNKDELYFCFSCGADMRGEEYEAD